VALFSAGGMKKLGKYEILEPLGGEGSSVYRARDTVLEREVALKTILTGPGAGNEAIQRFYREARACARLQHPNIVTVYDFGEQDGVAYIAMELLSGSDLQRVIAEKRPIALETRLELAAQIAAALGYAHSQGIVHRDIKPGNIFLQKDQAKILDFGVARLASSQLTTVGATLGTPDYMAPEQLAGQVCESRSDLFSAAIVFFEFFAYEHPFAGRSIPRRIMCEEPSTLRRVSPALPASMEEVLARGLEKDASRRFQSGEEFAAALRQVAAEVRPAPEPPLPAAQPHPNAPPPLLPDAILDALRLRARQLLEEDPESCLTFIGGLGPKRQADPELQRLRHSAESRRLEPAGALRPAKEPASRAPLPALSARATPVTRTPVAAPPRAERPAPVLQPLVRPSESPSGRSSVSRTFPAWPASQRRVLAGLAAAVLLATVGIIHYGDSASGRTSPVLGNAQVRNDYAPLLEAPREGARVLLTLRAGSAVSLLGVPGAGEAWVQAQPVSAGQPLATGYCRVADLTGWSSRNPETALRLLQTFQPAESASEEDLKAHLARLESFSREFGITPHGPAANLERARLHVLLAGRLQQTRRPAAEWQVHLDNAAGQLAMAAAEAALEPLVEELRAKVNELKRQEPGAPAGRSIQVRR
jgi:serine/threonine protein kinase